jgi:ABC-2 type transport system ATP-binding protein
MTQPTMTGPSGPGTDVGRGDTPLEFENVSRWYGNVVAVNDITLRVERGITGLLGANGAGKSTLLNLACGLLKPSAGTVRVAGGRAWKNPRIYAKVALVPERETVYGFLSGYEFALNSAKMHGLADPRAAAERAIQMVDLADAADRRMDTYSKGMRQRAKIAAALVHDPEILLLDEPFNGLDPRQRLQMTVLLQRLAGEGRSVVFSTHILEEIEQIAESVLVLVAGRLAASGHPREIRRLMIHRPHTFRVSSSDDRALAAALLAERAVVGVELAENGATVRVSDRGAFTRALPTVACAARVAIFELLPLDESLESVFSYLAKP